MTSNPAPLFIVGMPRSGTKLLRTILNNHAKIAIANNETEFLPNWIKSWDQFGDLSVEANFQRFFQWNNVFPFFQTRQRKGIPVSCSRWFASCPVFDLPGVFAGLILQDVDGDRELAYLGDKSPGYTYHIRELDRAFPQARFVHICRDARDYALSVNQAWGKNMIRAVQDWKEGLAGVADVENDSNIQIMTVRYEDILADSEEAIRSVCDFLEVPFVSSMLKLEKIVESVGDASGRSEVVGTNSRKYLSRMSSGTLKQIESICGRQLEFRGYAIHHLAGDENLSRLRRRVIHLFDSVQVLMSSIRGRGLIKGIKYSILFRLMKIRSGKRHTPDQQS